MSAYTFNGTIIEQDLGIQKRRYIIGAIRYGRLRKFVVPDLFDAETGLGEQRGVIESHARKLKKSMMLGKYSPTAFTIGTRDDQRSQIKIVDTNATIDVAEENPLPLLDGGNRCAALELIREEGGPTQVLVDNIHIPYLLYLDGDSKEDFLNLQAGKPVSRSHILSMKIASSLVDPKHAPFFNLAKKVASILHNDTSSFCHNLIQFDSRGAKLPLSLNSLASKGGSDIAFSLYGGAKIAIHHNKDHEWLAARIINAYNAINDDTNGNDLLSSGNILCPVPNGTKAGTSILIGIGNMLAARLWMLDKDEEDEEDMELLINSVVDNFDLQTKGNTSADRKRSLLHDFAESFFEDMTMEEIKDDEEHEEYPINTIGSHVGIPIPLIKLLSSSTFNVPKLPADVNRKHGSKSKKANTSKLGKDEVDIVVPRSRIPMREEDEVDAIAFQDIDSRKPNLDIDAELEIDENNNEYPWE